MYQSTEFQAHRPKKYVEGKHKKRILTKYKWNEFQVYWSKHFTQGFNRKKKRGFWPRTNEMNCTPKRKEISHIVKIKKKLRILQRYQPNKFQAHQSKIFTHCQNRKKKHSYRV